MEPREVFEETTSYALSRSLQPRRVDLEAMAGLSQLKIVAVTGARRSGKSSILMLLTQRLKEMGEKVAYINAEDTRIKPEALLEEVIKWFGDDGYLLIDEITSANDWAGWLARTHEMLKGRLKVIVSSSRSGLAEPPKMLRGRITKVEIFPLSFHEYLEFQNFVREPTTAGRGRLEQMFRIYTRYGGFPEVVLRKEDIEKVSVLNEYFREILGLDVAESSKGDVASVRLFGKYALNSSYFSASKCLNHFKSVGYKVGKESILRWEHCSQESYLFFFVPVFGRSVKDAAQYPRKIYPVDTGFFYGVGGLEDEGRAIECSVYLHMRRLLLPGEEIYYWRDKADREVDFVVKKGNRILDVIQVCSDLRDPKTRAREMRSLSDCLSELEVERGAIITRDPQAIVPPEDSRIVVKSVLDWMMKSGSA